MPSVVRSRSVSRERATVIDPGDPDNPYLDPKQLLHELLEHVNTLNAHLVVNLSDGVTKVEYPLNVFTSKLWPIRKDFVIFGLKRLKFSDLKANLTFEVMIQSDQPAISS